MLLLPAGGRYSYFMPGCTPVQPLLQLKKAFFWFAMKARKSYVASCFLEWREMTQCHEPPFVLPTWLRSYFFHCPDMGLKASVVPGRGAAPILPCTFDVLGSCANVGRSPHVGSIAEWPARNRFQPWPNVQLISSFGPFARSFT